MRVRIYLLNPIHPFPLFSWILKFIQRVGFSHTAIAFNGFVVDSSGKGVQLYNEAEYFKRYRMHTFYDVYIEEEMGAIMKWLQPHLNTKYSVSQLFGLLFMYLKWTKTNPFGRGDKGLICCELVMLFLERFKGIEVSDSDDYDLIRTQIEVEGVQHVSQSI